MNKSNMYFSQMIDDDEEDEDQFYIIFQKQSFLQKSKNSVNRSNRMPTRYSLNMYDNTQEIELHGKTYDEAQELVISALDSAKINHFRKILFITGRGRHSIDNIPVLKPMVLKISKKKGFNLSLSKNKEQLLVALIDHKKKNSFLSKNVLFRNLNAY